MTDSSTSNGSPIKEAASKIYEAWDNNLKFPKDHSTYKDLIESLEKRNPPKEDSHPSEDGPTRKELEQALIHSEDWANWSESQRKTASRYVNGHRKNVNEKSPLFPNVPQPFMGDLDNPKVVVVTFNPGFHDCVDWVLGGPYENEESMWSAISNTSKEKLQAFFIRMGYFMADKLDLAAVNAQCERAKRSWIAEQDKLLFAIRTDKDDESRVFTPWKKEQSKNGLAGNCDFLLPSPLNLHGENALPWIGGNWHCDYFAKSDDNPNHLRNYVQSDAKDPSDGIAQVELFPYQSPKGSDVKKLAPEALKHLEKDPVPWTQPEDHLIPSQIPIFNYLVALLSQVRSENVSESSSRTLVIARGSAAKTAMFKQAVLRAGGEDATELKKCVYQLSGQNSSLTLKNLKTLDGQKIIQHDKPSKEDYRKAAIALLGSNAVRTGNKES